MSVTQGLQDFSITFLRQNEISRDLFINNNDEFAPTIPKTNIMI